MKIKLILATAILLSLGATTQLLAQAPGRDRARREIGDVVIFNQGTDRLIVAMDTDTFGNDGLVDQWFTLQTLLPAAEIRVHLSSADVVYNDRFVRVTSPQDKKVYEFVLEGADAGPEVNAQYDVVRTEGFGLAHNAGDTTIRLSSDKRDPCADCASLTQDWGELGGDGGAGSCDAGGIGATSCSRGSGTETCSVNCSGSYYPCCRTLANGKVTCACYLKP
jgi:hypothetical protein